jgi:hypothetical protein
MSALAAAGVLALSLSGTGCRATTRENRPPGVSSNDDPIPAKPLAHTAQPERVPTHGSVNDLREGDIVFQTSLSEQSRAIERATHSPLSHTGVVLAQEGKLCVYEAVGPVKFTPVDAWIARGEGGHVLAKRLRPPKGPLSQENIAALVAAARPFRGRAYDFAFDWSDDKLYCSELVWKVYQRALGIELGKPRPLREYDLGGPEVQAKLRERFGDKIPMEEPMIAPGAIAESELLETVMEK